MFKGFGVIWRMWRCGGTDDIFIILPLLSPIRNPFPPPFLLFWTYFVSYIRALIKLHIGVAINTNPWCL